MIPKAATPFVQRVAAFLVLFVIFSGIIGPRVISHGLINMHGFQFYGGAGKALLFGAIALILLINRRDAALKLKPWHWRQLGWLVLALAALWAAWLGVGKLIADTPGVLWPLLVHASLLVSIAGALLSAFGWANTCLLAKTYRRELLLTLGLMIAFDGFLYLVYSLWQLLSATVLHVVAWLLGRVGLAVVVEPPRTLLLRKFGVTIAQTCSGIESIALFSGLYGVVGVLDWPRLNHRKFLAAFLPALLALFGCNILRVFGLILAGYYINPHIAFSLFHTYAGMVFFIIYSAIFWSISYRWMLRHDKRGA